MTDSQKPLSQTTSLLLPHPLAVHSVYSQAPRKVLVRTERELVDAVLRALDASVTAEARITQEEDPL